MKTSQKISLILTATLITLLSTSCGGDADKAAKALAIINGTQGSMVMSLKDDMDERALNLAQDAYLFGPQTSSSGPQMMMADCGSSLGTEWSGSGTVGDPYMIACDFTGQSATCGGTTYTFNSGSVNISFSASGSAFTFNMTLNANLSGGEFGDGLAINCTLAYDITVSASGSSASINSGSFSCTADGDEISLEDLQEEMAQQTCS